MDLQGGMAELRAAVCRAYSAAAREPSAKHPFPTGAQFAGELGYPAELLKDLPLEALESFSGVSSVSLFAEIPAGATVLDLGCGAGLDSFIAARRTGPQGTAIGLDFSEAMIRKASSAAFRCAAENTLFLVGDAERLPLPDASVGVALVNGIFNLNPWRERIFRELGRVVAPGGAVFAAELVLREAVPAEAVEGASSWFS